MASLQQIYSQELKIYVWLTILSNYFSSPRIGCAAYSFQVVVIPTTFKYPQIKDESLHFEHMFVISIQLQNPVVDT